MKEAFLNRMQDMLQEEYEDYLKTLSNPAYRGLRVNTLKTSADEIQKELPFSMKPTPFSKDSFYIDAALRSLGNHPYHMCGLCYLQEPSASSAVEILDIKPHDWVLDLCAAPGGKSTQIAAKLQHTGFLLSNEIDASRANILLSNLERIGASENMITNANPKVLCEQVQGLFDKVLVDAPCSGEGMFKKHSKAMEEWSIEHVNACSSRQSHILDSAYITLKEDGILVYSTCTYAIEENEKVIYEFLQNHPDMELINAQVTFGRSGLPYKDLTSAYVRRIFPMDQGEGHFIAKMKRTSFNSPSKLFNVKQQPIPEFVKAFLKDQLVSIPSHIHIDHQQIYLKQTPFLKLKNIRVLRQGILCGEIRKERIEPHHHFYMSAFLQPHLQHLAPLTKEQVHTFYSGNVVPVKGYHGYCALSYQGHILGYGKGDGVCIKNKLPKGLRCQIESSLF